MPKPLASPITLDSYDLALAERLLCERALHDAGSIILAAEFLGITRHSLKRRIIKLGITWPREVPTSSGRGR